MTDRDQRHRVKATTGWPNDPISFWEVKKMNFRHHQSPLWLEKTTNIGKLQSI